MVSRRGCIRGHGIAGERIGLAAWLRCRSMQVMALVHAYFKQGRPDHTYIARIAHRRVIGIGEILGCKAKGCHFVLALAKTLDAQRLTRGQQIAAVVHA